MVRFGWGIRGALLTAGLMLASALVGCQAFNRVDAYGTAQAQSASFDAEIAAMTEVATVEGGAAVATIAAEETAIAGVNGINQQFIATLALIVTPTPQIFADAASIDPTLQAEFEGRRLFIKTGVSTEINPDDGCVVNPRSSFSENETRLYGTLRALNVEAGVQMRAEWRRDGALVWEDAWTVDQNYADICIWFFVENTDIEFTPGAWSVEFFADGFSLEGATAFTLGDAMMDDAMMDDGP
jgi:hypothetical protein